MKIRMESIMDGIIIKLVDQGMNYFGDEPANNYAQQGGYTPFSDNLPHENAKVSDLYGAARTAFIRRVYTVLAVQILVTVIMTGLSMTSLAYFRFQLQHVGLFYVCMILALAIEIYVFCCEGGRKYPQNIISTVVFTLCEGYVVSFIASLTGVTSGNHIVFLAAFLTLVIVVACTLYAFYTKQDFTTSSALVVVIAALMLAIFVILLFTNSPFLQTVYCGLGVLLFGIYIIIDTQMIVGGKTIELQIDEYYLGAMLLYIDVVMIFVYLLQLLGGNNNSNQ